MHLLPSSSLQRLVPLSVRLALLAGLVLQTQTTMGGTPERVLYIRADFEDKSMGISDALWHSRFTNLDSYAEDFWVHNTYGEISSFDSAITEIFTLPPALTPDSPYESGGDVYAIRSAMRGAASAAGWSLGNYDQVILSFPGLPQFPAGALGTPGTVWMPGSNPFDGGYVHEFGHALGVGHAHHLEGVSEVYPGEVRGGRDGLWMMGSEGGVNLNFDGRRAPVNLPMRYRIGAVDEQLINRTEQTDVYRIYDFARADVSDDIAMGRSLATVFDHDGREFWISYAPDLAELWKNFNGAGWTDGIVVSDLRGDITHSLDFTPGSQGGTGNEADYVDSRDGALRVGQSYTFPDSVITLSPLAIGESEDGVRWIDVYLNLGGGDFNGDTEIDLDDYHTLVQNLHADLSSYSPAEAYRRGDITGDNLVDYQDLVGFQSAYLAAGGSAADLAVSAVPEPDCVIFVLQGLLVGCLLLNRRR